MTILLAVLLGLLYSEFVGYWIHRLLHSEKIPSLSKDHMIHHLKLYSPKGSMRSETYLRATGERFSVGNIGVEWLAPLAVVIGATIAFMTVLSIPVLSQFLFLGSAILWGIFGFSYIHDGLHVSNFWMLNNRFINTWFKKIRRLHDIHHTRITNDGKMHVNFGMCFFILDRIFGTKAEVTGRFNEAGYEEAKKRYSFINKE